MTVFFTVSNFGTGFLAVSANSSTAVLTLQSTDLARFPDTFPYRVSVDEEIMEVTAKDSNLSQLQVIRGLEGTTATTHLSLSMVSLRVTAEGFQRIYDAINTLEHAVGRVQVRVDEGLDAGERPRIHFLSGTGIQVTAVDDNPNDEVRVTIESLGIVATGPIGPAGTPGIGLPGEDGDDGETSYIPGPPGTDGATAAHNDNHATGGTDAFTSADLLDAIARVTVRKNSGANVGSRRRVNFIEGTGITITIADDAGGEEIDVTIDASGGGGDDVLALALAVAL